MKVDRMTGAEAISKKAIAMSLETGVVISKCEWDIGVDFAHEHAHRLDLFTESKTVRLYFPDLELTNVDDLRARKTESRLRGAIAQLATQSPAATYTFS